MKYSKYNLREFVHAKRGLESRFPLNEEKGSQQTAFFRYICCNNSSGIIYWCEM